MEKNKNNTERHDLYNQVRDELRKLLPNIGDHMFIRDDHTLVTKPLPPIIGDDEKYDVELIYITHSKTNDDNNEYQFFCGTNRGGLLIEEMNAEYLKHLNKLMTEKRYTVELRRDDSEYKELMEIVTKQDIRDRIVTPSARRFTPDQIENLKIYAGLFPDTPAGELFTKLYKDVIKDPDVARKPEKWQADTLKELENIAQGKVHEEAQQLKK